MTTTRANHLLRMRCASKRHRRLFPIPEGCHAGSDALIHENKARLIGGRYAQALLECASEEPCWESPVHVRTRGHMKLVAVIGRATATRCGPRCESAAGDDCECECAGTNHGRLA